MTPEVNQELDTLLKQCCRKLGLALDSAARILNVRVFGSTRVGRDV
jgi:hypothetical protein